MAPPTTTSSSSSSSTSTPSIRKNAKSWHPRRAAFRPTTSNPSFAARMARTSRDAEVKQLAAEMKADKEAERERRVQGIKDRRAAKEERERFAEVEARMGRKRAERLKRREKRNKKLDS